VVFAVVSIALIAFVRPVAMRHLKRAPETLTGVDALVGLEAVVVEQVDAREGRVKLRGEVWSARSVDNGSVHTPGETVHVVRVSGATVLVS